VSKAGGDLAYLWGLQAYRNYRWFSSPERMRMRATVRRWIRACPIGGRVLEVGGGTSALRPVIEREVARVRYLSGDISPTNNTTLVLDASALPVRDGSLDAVLALEVLEHLPQPALLLQESARVLAPGGMLVVTTPFMFGVHDFRDYFRYTPLGFKVLVEGAGLELQEVVLRGGTFVSIVSLLRALIRNAILGDPQDWRAKGTRKKVLWAFVTMIETPWVPVMWLALALDRVLDRHSKSPPGYFFLSRKPGAN
jgi:SAM-dependent methyltransferase